MQITLNQTEIENAVREYITNQGLSFGSGIPEVTLTAGRAPTGFTASIEFSNMVVVPKKPADLDTIPSKPQVDLEPFTPDPVQPTKEESKPIIETEPETTDLVEEEPKPSDTSSELFGDTIAQTSDDIVPDTDSLFAI